jgi:hypothetical protein
MRWESSKIQNLFSLLLKRFVSYGTIEKKAAKAKRLRDELGTDQA